MIRRLSWLCLASIAAATLVRAPLLQADEPATASAEVEERATRRGRGVEDFGIPHVAFINAQIEAGWEDAGIRPSRPATDGEWCRRVYLDVVGRIPSLDELQAF